MKPTRTVMTPIITPASFCSQDYIKHLNGLFFGLTEYLETWAIDYLAMLLAWKYNQDLYDFFEPCCILCTTDGDEASQIHITFKKLNGPETEPLTPNILEYLINNQAFKRLDDAEVWPTYDKKQILHQEYFTLVHTFKF